MCHRHDHQVPVRCGLGQAQVHVQVHGGRPGRLLGRPRVPTDATFYKEDDGDITNGSLFAKIFYLVLIFQDKGQRPSIKVRAVILSRILQHCPNPP